jgi:hypothetical protein
MFQMLKHEWNLILGWVNMLHLRDCWQGSKYVNSFNYKKQLWLPVYQRDNRWWTLGENVLYIRRYSFCDLGGEEKLHLPSLLAEPCTRVGWEKWNEVLDDGELQSSSLSLARRGEHRTSPSEPWLKLMRRARDRATWLPAEASETWLLPASLLILLSTSVGLLACGQTLQ